MWRRCAAGLAAVLVMAGCGGSDSTTETTETDPTVATTTTAAAPESTTSEAAPTTEASTVADLDACGFFTRAEVEAVVGVELADPVAEPMPPLFFCDYGAAGDPRVSISVIVHPDAAAARASHEIGVEVGGNEPMDGIGDAAYNAQPVGDITAIQGNYEISVSMYFLSDDDAELDMASQLARELLTRLP